MADFPNNVYNTPRYLSVFSRFSGLLKLQTLIGNTGGGTPPTWPVANLALYIPMVIPFRYVVQRAWVPVIGSSPANIDFGIYNTDGTRIWSAGTTTKLTTSVMQFITPAAPFALEPGSYYFAATCSNTTASQSFALGGNLGGVPSRYRHAGFLEQASALPLPAVATFAAISSTTYWPLCGVTRLASGF